MKEVRQVKRRKNRTGKMVEAGGLMKNESDPVEEILAWKKQARPKRKRGENHARVSENVVQKRRVKRLLERGM